MSSPVPPPRRRPVLLVLGGLPATGKTTVARMLAAQLRAAYLRIDTIETAIGRAEGEAQATNGWQRPPGYEIGYDLAADQLRLNLDVVAESVNPLPASRDAWYDAGCRAGARVVEVELVCSDVEEHRRRAQERVLDIPGLTKPTWQQIVNRDYAPWHRDRVVIDTAVLSVDEAAQRLRVAAETPE